MTIRLVVIFAACLGLCASQEQVEVNRQLLDTPVDLDNWNSDKFSPAIADYDKFDWKLTKSIAASSHKNFLLSPLGVKLALAILTEAATGVTQNELSSVLGFDLDRRLVREKFSTIKGSLQKESPPHILNLGSSIYIGDNAQPRPRFVAIAQEFYKTELKTVNFLDPDVAATEINTWGSNVTKGRIRTLVKKNDVANMVMLVLNTLYFRGSWSHQFAPDATKIDIFYVSYRIQKIIPVMNVIGRFYYTMSSKYDAKILRMPYKGNKYAMYLIVPNSLVGLPRVLNDINDLQLELSNLREHLVNVKLPKFKLEYTSQLDDVLRELGVRTAFKDTASFPGIARSQDLEQPLRLSKVLQQASIEVNEVGSTAYTPTDVDQSTETDTLVVANRPFLFFIQDEATRQLLFTGRVVDPTLTDGAFKVYTN